MSVSDEYLLESYASNRPLRQRYLTMNGITHAYICDASDCLDCRDDNAYRIFFGDANQVGTWGEREFDSMLDARNWLAKFAPELNVV